MIKFIYCKVGVKKKKERLEAKFIKLNKVETILRIKKFFLKLISYDTQANNTVDPDFSSIQGKFLERKIPTKF